MRESTFEVASSSISILGLLSKHLALASLCFSPVEKWPEIEEGDGFLYYEYVYVDEETGDQYYNLVAVYKCDTSFYIVNFETMNENKSSFYDKLMECFESVTIK